MNLDGEEFSALKATLFLVVCLLDLLFLLQRDLLNAYFWHTVHRITFAPAFSFDQFGQTFRTRHHVARLHRTSFDFEAFVDSHRTRSVQFRN